MRALRPRKAVGRGIGDILGDVLLMRLGVVWEAWGRFGKLRGACCLSGLEGDGMVRWNMVYIRLQLELVPAWQLLELW